MEYNMTGVQGCPVKLDANGDREKCMEAERAADAAVHKTFAIMGIDVDSPKQVSEFQEGLTFNRKLNVMANRTVIGVIIAGSTILTGLVIKKLLS